VRCREERPAVVPDLGASAEEWRQGAVAERSEELTQSTMTQSRLRILASKTAATTLDPPAYRAQVISRSSCA
jgi:hypothetical protein